MFLHRHPYAPFIPEGSTRLIVGTLPPPRFTTGNLLPTDVNFCYGSSHGLLWPILDALFNLNLVYKNVPEAIQQRKMFLETHKIGVCDIVASAQREKVDASDLGMRQVALRDMFKILQTHTHITTLLFMGGNSKNGPEYFFRQQAKKAAVPLITINQEVPRIYQFCLPNSKRTLRTVSLTAPSGAANRAIGSMSAYKLLKSKNPEYTTFDFRVKQYRPFFKGGIEI